LNGKTHIVIPWPEPPATVEAKVQASKPKTHPGVIIQPKQVIGSTIHGGLVFGGPPSVLHARPDQASRPLGALGHHVVRAGVPC
jgi:hypothetical protein